MEEALPDNNALKIRYLGSGIFAGAIITYTILSFSYISNESALMLMIFNFLFISLVFPLKGKLVKKMMLLFVGNIVGLLWNNIFSLFAYTAVHCFGEVFNIWYAILNPLLNLVWIVSFWSMSLSFLASSRDNKSGAEIES
jgi:hypothetical protein